MYKIMNNISGISFVFLFFCTWGGPSALDAQAPCLTPEELIAKATRLHPSMQKVDLARRESELQNQWLRKHRLPQLDWNTRGSLQSESISLNFPIPNAPQVELPLYGFQSTLDGQYVLYDGGVNKAMAALAEEQVQMKTREVNVKVREVKAKVVALYFGIALMDKRSELLDSALYFITDRKRRLELVLDNGAAIASDLTALDAKRLEVLREQAEVAAIREGYRSGLNGLTGLQLGDTALCYVSLPPLETLDYSHRPEYDLFEEKSNLIDARLDLQKAKQRPKISAAVKAGVGYPNPVNLFDDQLAPFALAAIQLHWPIGLWGKNRVERQKLKLANRETAIQKASFEWGMRNQVDQISSRLKGMQGALSLDDQLVDQYSAILETKERQFQEGEISLLEVLDAENDQRTAKLKRALHTVGVAQLGYQLKVLLAP